MKIRMRTRMAGVHGTARPGDVIDVAPELARELIAARAAVVVEDAEDFRPQQAEQAVKRRGRRAKQR